MGYSVKGLSAAERSEVIAAAVEAAAAEIDLSPYQQKPTITELAGATVTQALADNTEYRAGELTALTLTLPSSYGDTFESSIVFTSGATATNVTYPDGIKWSGMDIADSDGVTGFAPIADQRYNISFWWDGLYTNAVVRGVEYEPET